MKTKTKFLLLLIILCSSRYVNAQTFNWVNQVQGTGDKIGVSMAVDNAGNIYVTGRYVNTINFGAISMTSSSNLFWDIFVAKADANMNWLWAKSAGGGHEDVPLDLAVNKATGECYIAGYYKSSTCSFSGTVITNNNSFVPSGYVAKYSSAGVVNWVQNIQSTGGGDESCTSIAVDNQGAIYITGSFATTTVNVAGTTITGFGAQDGFVSRLHPVTGNAIWGHAFGTSGACNDMGSGICVNPSTGTSYVTGYFTGPASFGSGVTLSGVGPVNCSDLDAYVASYDINGNCLWALQGGGLSADGGKSIALDNAGNCYMLGGFNGTSTYGATSLLCAGVSDIVIAKCNSGGWLWAKRAYSTSNDVGNDIVTEPSGFSYITGTYAGNCNFGSTTLINNGGMDMFAAKYDINGNNIWAVGAGSTLDDIGSGVAIDGTCRLSLIGTFVNTVTFGSLPSITSPVAGRPSAYIASMTRHAANAGPDNGSSYCCGVSIGTPGQPGATYSWTPTGSIIGPSNTDIVFAQPTVTTTYTLTMTLNGCVTTDQVTVTPGPGPCCRIEGELLTEMDLHPNPTSGILKFNSDKDNPVLSVTVYDVAGAVVKEEEIKENESQFSIEELQNGIYIVKLHTQNEDVVKRIVKN